MDDKPHATQRVHQRGDLDVEPQGRTTQKKDDHPKQEGAEETQVVPPKGEKEHADDEKSAGECEFVHVRPRHTSCGDASEDIPAQLQRESQNGEGGSDTCPYETFALTWRHLQLHRGRRGRHRWSHVPDRHEFRSGRLDARHAHGKVDGIRRKGERVNADGRPHHQQGQPIKGEGG